MHLWASLIEHGISYLHSYLCVMAPPVGGESTGGRTHVFVSGWAQLGSIGEGPSSSCSLTSSAGLDSGLGSVHRSLLDFFVMVLQTVLVLGRL